MYLNLEIERAPEYLQRSIEENRQKFSELMELRAQATDKDTILNLSNQIRELINKDNKEHLDINLSYIRSFESNPAAVLEDVGDILQAIEKDDFLNWLEDKLAFFREQQEEQTAADPTEKTEDEEDALYYKDLKRDYKSAVVFLQDTLYLQVEALYKWDNDGLNELRQMTEEKAAEWYEREQLPEEVSNHNLKMIINRFAPVLSIDYPIDRPNNTIWKSLEAIDTDGQLTIAQAVLTGKGKKDKDINVLISVSWDQPGTKITTTLNSFDKRVYCACASLLKAGNSSFTITEICKIMTGNGKPSNNQIKKVNDSLTKMRAATLYYSNKHEIEKGLDYPPLDYDSALLPFERIKAVVYGKEVTAIHLFREPPLITFARERKQITSFKKQLLQVPINDTEENLRIQDYLLTTISAMKKKKALYFDILFLTIKEDCKIGSKHFDRVPNKIDTCLNHYMQNGFIRDYEIKNDRITIDL